MARMQILSASEQSAFDTPPLFDFRERQKFFDLSKALLETAGTLQNPAYQVFFLVSCGYFRATKRFFSPDTFHQRDVAYVASKLNVNDVSAINYSSRARQRHQKVILAHYGVNQFDKNSRKMLALEIAAMSEAHLKPRLIFDRCIDFLTQYKIQIPSARSLSDLIRSGLQNRKAALITLMDTHITDKARCLMDNLFTTSDDQTRYRLTLLKKLSQSTKPTRIRERAADFSTLAELYDQLEDILQRLNLGHAGTRYFAGSVLRSEIFQIRRREANDRYIHAAAFVAHQFFRIHDNLIDVMLNVMKAFQTAASREHKEMLLEKRKEHDKRLKAEVEKADKSVSGLVRNIRSLTDSDALSDTQKVIKIREVLDRRKTGIFDPLKADLQNPGSDQSWYEVLEGHSLKLQNRLNPILKALTFEASERVSSLMEAISHFKDRDGVVTERAPVKFLSPEDSKALSRKDGSFRSSLYKVMLFQYVAEAVKSGDLNVEQSYKYRAMDTYLIDPERWNREKQQLLERAGLTKFAAPAPILQELDTALLAQYQATNGNIEANPHLKFRVDGSFHVKTPTAKSSENDPPQELFPERHDVPLAQVLETTHNHCGMLGALEHWQQTRTRQSVPRTTLLAGIMGLGCSIGVRKMARISANVTESELEHAVNWRFSHENIRAANDLVLKAMDQMELPNLYRRDAELLHTASDGQKFEVRGESLLAARSFKYFGQSQGVSAYTFGDERSLLWHSLMISAADRESTYVIDGLMHNDVVKSDIHSTDSHGYSETIFALTHLLGFSFAPRIKKLHKQRIYLFRGHDRKIREGWRIRPNNYVNEALIQENWDDLLRLVATIKLKENTASDIFRRLNSYSRQHALYQTLKAFGQIIKSLFILRYIKDLDLRQAIEKQLNKVELANKFTRAVAVGNPREFTQAEKEEQEIAEACNRLIKNSIICWNYLYLTRQVNNCKDQQTRETLLRTIAAHSPISWAHINMLGEYDFSEDKLRDALGILPVKLAA